jgi:hypothetical protein
MTDEELRARMELLGAEASALQAKRPRPAKKPFGARGPTPEQAARWRADILAWNRAWRAYLSEYQLAVEVSNQRYHAARGRAGAAARAVTSVATHAIERGVASILLEGALL